MRRREFITLVGGAAVAWPLAARAQPPAMPVVGLVNGRSQETSVRLTGAYSASAKTRSRAASAIGLQIAVLNASTSSEIEAAFATLVRDRADALFVGPDGLFVSRRVQFATLATRHGIPTAYALREHVEAGGDLGLVASLSRPDSNLTGATTLTLEVGPKWLQLLHEMVPNATSLALLINPTSPNLAESQSKDLQTAARSRGLRLHVLQASTDQDFDRAFASVGRLGAGGVVISSDSFFFGRSALLATLAVRHAVPTIFGFREFVAAGGLMSYGGSLTESFRWVGVYTGRVLKGEKLANLPVQQSTKIELSINLKTAQALGLEVPPTLLTRADEVIE